MTTASLRLVIDTNVVVAALLHPGRTPDLALRAIRERHATVLVDPAIEAEYRAVLARPKFAAIEEARRAALLALLLDGAERVASAPGDDAMIDAHDRIFVDVARAGRADAIVTGNARHFPSSLGLVVMSPTQLLAWWPLR